MKTLLYTFILFAFTATASGQGLNKTLHSFASLDILNYLFIQQGELSYKIHRLVAEEAIKPYGDEGLKSGIAVNDFLKLGGRFEKKKISNPYNPDDIYDLIDTLLHYPADPYTASFRLYIGKVFVYIISENDSVFMDYEKLLKHLSKEEKAFLDFFNYRKYEIIDGPAISHLSVTEFDYLKRKIYTLGFDARIPAYKDDSMQKVLTAYELEENTSVRWNKQVRNPNNPDDKYDLIDTVITDVYTADSMTRLLFLNLWLHEDFNATGHLVGIAPAFQPKAEGLVLPHRPVFWARWDDLANHFTKDELTFYQYLFFFNLKKSVGHATGQYTPLGNEN